MSKTLYLLLGAAAGAAATYLYLNPDTAGHSSTYAIDKASLWGSKKRLSGSGETALGKLKQGVGKATGNDELAGKGVFDQVKGAVKDAAGQVAHAAVDAAHEASK